MFNKIIRPLLLAILVILIPFHHRSKSIKDRPITEPAISFEFTRSINPKIILITIDGVRWQDLFNGMDRHLAYPPLLSSRELLPHIYNHFVDNGIVIGKTSSIIATGPMRISLPGYLEIMRGHPSEDCQTNTCDPKVDFTIANLFETSTIISSWDVIYKTVNLDKIYYSCGRKLRSNNWSSLNLEDNQTFPEYWNEEYRPDFLTQQIAIDYLQHYRPQFLWVSLGDEDENAHSGNYMEYLKALQSADLFIEQIFNMIDKDYTVILTEDHGRSSIWQHHGFDNESAKVFLMMSGRGIPKSGFVSYRDEKSLSNILPTVKHLITSEYQIGSLL